MTHHLNHELEEIAQQMVAKGKGILAADESTGTITKRLASVDVESTEETRRTYRNLLFTTSGIEENISGVILFDETIRQSADDGTPFPELLSDRRILPGIKVDMKAKPLAGFPGEKVTEGLTGLRERLEEYVELGAKFAKWRAVITIGDGIPTRFCIEANSHALARYAALCQEAGIVPIVEPEVLMDGDHDIERCDEVTTAMLNQLFYDMLEHRVMLEGAILKPNMVLSGKGSPVQADVQEVAERTVRTMRRVVPPAVPGIAFLSGGQSAELATEHLNAMNTMGDHPWNLTYSYGRALQQPTLNEWRGNSAKTEKAQQLLQHRAKCNGAATLGQYSKDMEKIAA
ncbi:MAG TPA: class I fructose-bisphosphate aldolase [bacterium]|nr:class I fructose-bisphosphate aldolase [bacterium]